LLKDLAASPIRGNDRLCILAAPKYHSALLEYRTAEKEFEAAKSGPTFASLFACAVEDGASQE